MILPLYATVKVFLELILWSVLVSQNLPGYLSVSTTILFWIAVILRYILWGKCAFVVYTDSKDKLCIGSLIRAFNICLHNLWIL